MVIYLHLQQRAIYSRPVLFWGVSQGSQKKGTSGFLGNCNWISKPSFVPGKYDSCMYIYIYVLIYIYIHTYIHTCLYIYIHIHVYTVYLNIYTYTHVQYTSLVIFAVWIYLYSIGTYSTYNCQGPASNFGESIFHFCLVAGESKEAVGHTKASGCAGTDSAGVWDPSKGSGLLQRAVFGMDPMDIYIYINL